MADAHGSDGYTQIQVFFGRHDWVRPEPGLYRLVEYIDRIARRRI